MNRIEKLAREKGGEEKLDESLSDLYRQLFHFSTLVLKKENFDDEVNAKEDEFFTFVGSDFKEKMMGMVVLNVGCGPTPLRFPDAKKEIGIDPLICFFTKLYPEKYLKHMDLITGFASRMYIKDDFIDFIYCARTIEYINDWRESLNEMHRILKKGGYLSLFYYSWQGDRTNLNLLAGFDMKRHLESVGFEIVKFSRDKSTYTKILGRKK